MRPDKMSTQRRIQNSDLRLVRPMRQTHPAHQAQSVILADDAELERQLASPNPGRAAARDLTPINTSTMVLERHRESQLHQEKYYLRLMRRRCVLTSATSSLRPVRPERPELRCNLLYVLSCLATIRCIPTRLHPTSTSG